MAIKISGTNVITDGYQLANITSLDATTTATIGSAAGGGGTSIDLVADGAITAGDAVGVTSDGKAKKVSQLYGSYQQDLTPTGGIYYMGYVHYDTAANVFVLINRSQGQSFRAYLQAFDLSGFTVSAGTPVYISSSVGAGDGHSISESPTDGKNIVVYYTSSTGYAHAFTCSGTTITQGSAQSLSTCNGQPMVSYNPDQNNYAYFFRNGSTSNNGKILTTSSSNYNVGVSGNYTIASGNYYGAAVVYDTTANKHVLFTAFNANNLKAVVVTNNGSSLSAGTGVDTGCTNYHANAVFDPVSGKTILAYGESTTGIRIRTVTVSGTSVTLGADLALTNYVDSTSVRPHLATDGNGNIVLIAIDSLVAGTERVTTLVVNGTDMVPTNTYLTHGTGSNGGNNGAGGLAYSPDDSKYLQITGQYNSAMDAYALDTSSPYGTFIGFAQSTVSSGSTVTVDLIGSENSSQSGLTTGLAYGIDATTGNLNPASNPKVAIATASTKALVIGGTS